MFVVKKEAFGKFNRLILLNNATKEKVAIVPEYGANVNELVLEKEESYSQ